MFKYNFIVSISLISLFVSGCSLSSEGNIKPKQTQTKEDFVENYVERDTTILNLNVNQDYYLAQSYFKKIHNDFILSSRKVEELGLYLHRTNSIGSINSLSWYYGPNLGLSKEDTALLAFVDKGTLQAGFGLKDQLKIQFLKNFPKSDLVDLDSRSQEIGFFSFNELFDAVYQRLTFSSETEFIDLIYNLEKRGVISSWRDISVGLNPEPLISSFFESFLYYGVDEENIFFIEKDKKYMLDTSDFRAYYLTMYIVSNIIDNAKNRESLYAI